MTDVTTRRDARPAWLRVLVWCGFALGFVIGLPVLVVGLAAFEEPGGQFALCFGLVLLVSAGAGAAREVAEHRITRHPPEPRLDTLPDGEHALFLPRATEPTRVASLALLGYAVVVGLGAVLAASHPRWGLAVVLALVAAWLLRVAAPHRGDALAGGLWFTPSRLVHEHQGVRWQVPWEDVTGAVPQQPMPVLVRADRAPTLERTGPRGRAWNPRRGDGMLAVDTSHLPGGSRLAGYLVTKALADPASRRVLGTPESLPPTSVRR